MSDPAPPDQVPYVKPQNSLRKKQKKDKIKQMVFNKVQKIPRYQELKTHSSIDNELLLFICNCVENLVKKSYNIDKKELVVEIVCCLFTLSEPEKAVLREAIQFLYDNGMIQVIGCFSKASHTLIGYIKRKLG